MDTDTDTDTVVVLMGRNEENEEFRVMANDNCQLSTALEEPDNKSG